MADYIDGSDGELDGLPVNKWAHIGAHNGFASKADKWLYYQQEFDFDELVINHNVRAIELDVYSPFSFLLDDNDENPTSDIRLCHEKARSGGLLSKGFLRSECSLVSDWFRKIRTALEGTKTKKAILIIFISGDFVTDDHRPWINEIYAGLIGDGDTTKSIDEKKADLEAFFFTPEDKGEGDWPTLGDLRKLGQAGAGTDEEKKLHKRLIMFKTRTKKATVAPFAFTEEEWGEISEFGKIDKDATRFRNRIEGGKQETPVFGKDQSDKFFKMSHFFSYSFRKQDTNPYTLMGKLFLPSFVKDYKTEVNIVDLIKARAQAYADAFELAEGPRKAPTTVHIDFSHTENRDPELIKLIQTWNEKGGIVPIPETNP